MIELISHISNGSMTIRTGRHCVFALHVHLVFVTKYRGKVFSKTHLKTLQSLFEPLCIELEAELVEFNGESDHVHLLVTYPPKLALSKLVNALKGVSGRRMKRLHPELAQPAYLKNSLWSASYFAGSCGGASLDTIKTYIDNQSTPL